MTFFNHDIFEPLLPLGVGQNFVPHPPPIVSYTPFSHAPSRWHGAFSWSLCSPKLYMSVAGERERDSQGQGLSRRRTDKQHHESAPPNLQERGPLAPQPPSPHSFPPIPPCAHRSLVDVSCQQRSTEARRQKADLRAADGSRGGHGEPDQDAEDQSSSFSVPGFFLNLMCCTPFPHTCRGRKCPEWGGGVFSLSFF